MVAILTSSSRLVTPYSMLEVQIRSGSIAFVSAMLVGEKDTPETHREGVEIETLLAQCRSRFEIWWKFLRSNRVMRLVYTRSWLG